MKNYRIIHDKINNQYFCQERYWVFFWVNIEEFDWVYNALYNLQRWKTKKFDTIQEAETYLANYIKEISQPTVEIVKYL